MNSTTETQHTALIDFHRQHQAKLVEFAGYMMPLNYPAGIIKEHLHTRASAGLFDVSHMGQIMVTGTDIAGKLESVLPIDLKRLPEGRQKYALFLNQRGGVLDDLMVQNCGSHFILVVNAATKDADFEYLHRTLDGELNFEMLSLSLLALQGPKAAEALTSLGAKIDDMKFMDVRSLDISGMSCLVSRSGYSGEDGFEISVNNSDAQYLAEQLLAHEAVELVGLGARDSLRTEAGLPLYGQDLTPETTPAEANMKWAISPARRNSGKRAGGFPGADKILEQLDQGTERLLVGLAPQGKAPVRHGVQLFDTNDNAVGTITSGCYSPSLSRPICMGYVNTEFASEHTELFAEVRGKRLPVTVTSMPFVPHQYKR